MTEEFFPPELKCCPCGRKHVFPLKKIVSGKGVISGLADILNEYGVKKPFIVADENTFKAAGERVIALLEENGIVYSKFLFKKGWVEPDERATESVFRAFDSSCDAVIGVGSGVINDICKILAQKEKRFYIIVATAPSMDGYASATSSMTVKGLKTSVKSKCPDVIIGDVDILKNAPVKMLQAGLGDMLAKYVSIAEWRISHEINGEYYCENIARLVRLARDKCVDNVSGLINREESAVKAVFDGLIIGGVAMSYAGLSRPASGVEHYISHVIDMRSAEFHEKAELHGLQCATATVIATKLYDRVKNVIPSEEKGFNRTRAFDYSFWERDLREFLGKAAEPMIELEKKEGKYDALKADKRRKIIISKWKTLKKIMDEELPSVDYIKGITRAAGLSQTFDEAGINIDLKKAFAATKDIRDKYVLSSLLWDIGLLDEFCAEL